MKLKSKSSKERVNAPEGVHNARCVQVLDMGTQYSEKFDKSQHKVQLGFELVDETHVFNEEKGEQPFVVYRTYTLSSDKKAALVKDLSSWLGIKLDKDSDFDMETLIGKACQIQIMHNESDDAVYANIQNIMPAPKKGKVKEAVTDTRFLSLEPEEFDKKIFDDLPDFLKELIEVTPEYKALSEKPKKAPVKTKKK